MADGRRNNGGARPNSGRPSKAEEFKLVEKLDKLIDPDYAIEKMFHHIEKGSEKMLEIYLAYRFGKPTQSHDHTNNGGKFGGSNPVIFIGGKSQKENE